MIDGAADSQLQQKQLKMRGFKQPLRNQKQHLLDTIKAQQMVSKATSRSQSQVGNQGLILPLKKR
jgi:hypothetical protein